MEDTQTMKTERRWTTAMLLLVLAVILALATGRYPIRAWHIPRLLLSPSGSDSDTIARTVLLSIRLPRVLFAGLVGAALATAGAVFQGLFRNPLVSPNILGVSSGASCGAAIAIVFLNGTAVSIQASAFFCGLLAVILATAVGSRVRGTRETTLVLAGIAVSSLFSSLIMLLKAAADPEQHLPAIAFWLMGGLHRVTWTSLVWSAPMIISGLFILIVLRWKLNVLAMGEEEAESLGLAAGQYRAVFIAVATLIIAAGVSVAGAIGWVGLVIPHIVRMMAGADHKRLIPLSAIVGAAFLILADTIARSLSTTEIPIGILTSFIGAPFFIYLLVRRDTMFSV